MKWYDGENEMIIDDLKIIYYKSMKPILFLFLIIAVNIFPAGAIEKLNLHDEPQLIKTDRWLEIDLYWFNKDSISSSVDKFWGERSDYTYIHN